MISVPRIYNATIDILANAFAQMSPLKYGFFIEIIYKPFVPDNITNFRVFNDDQQILYFISNTDVFKDEIIEEDDVIKEDEHDKALQDSFQSSKGNTMSKVVGSLEKLYDLQN